MLVLIPLLLLALPLPPTKGKWAVHKKDWVFAGAVAIGALSLAAYLLPTPLFPRRKSTLPLLLLRDVDLDFLVGKSTAEVTRESH